MMRKFASLKHSAEFGYAYDTQAEWNDHAPIDRDFRMYQTYSDGLTQHSHDWTITQEYMADYLASLAQAMLTDAELAHELHYKLARYPRADEIAFCAGIVFKPAPDCTSYEKKTRYFSVKEKKLTSSPVKEYDKRYQKVGFSHNGTPEAIYNMLLPEYAKGLERYQWAQAVHDWAMADDGMWMELPAVFLKWTKDPQVARELGYAFECARNVVESYRLRSAAESTIESINRNVARTKEQQAFSKLAADREVGETDVEVQP